MRWTALALVAVLISSFLEEYIPCLTLYKEIFVTLALIIYSLFSPHSTWNRKKAAPAAKKLSKEDEVEELKSLEDQAPSDTAEPATPKECSQVVAPSPIKVRQPPRAFFPMAGIREEKIADEDSSAPDVTCESKAKINKWRSVGKGLSEVMNSFDDEDTTFVRIAKDEEASNLLKTDLSETVPNSAEIKSKINKWRAVGGGLARVFLDFEDGQEMAENTPFAMTKTDSSKKAEFSDAAVKSKLKKWNTVGGGLARVFQEFDGDDEGTPSTHPLRNKPKTSQSVVASTQNDQNVRKHIRKMCTVGKGLAEVLKSFESDDETVVPDASKISELPSGSEVRDRAKKWHTVGNGLAHVFQNFDEDKPVKLPLLPVEVQNKAKTQIKKTCAVSKGLARVLRKFDLEEDEMMPRMKKARAKAEQWDEGSGNESDSTNDTGTLVCDSSSDSESKSASSFAVSRKAKACSPFSGSEDESTTDAESGSSSGNESSSDNEALCKKDQRALRKWNEVSGSLAWAFRNASQDLSTDDDLL